MKRFLIDANHFLTIIACGILLLSCAGHPGRRAAVETLRSAEADLSEFGFIPDADEGRLGAAAEWFERHGSAADRINMGLGQIAKAVTDRAGMDRIAGIYATGGDTMVFTCTALGVRCLEVFDYVIPQTDIGALVGGKYDGLPIVGKGGLTGHDNIACDIVTRLFNEAARVK